MVWKDFTVELGVAFRQFGENKVALKQREDDGKDCHETTV
jgi:hypothetical protein